MINGRVAQLAEAFVWLAFAGLAYLFSHDFDRGIEIYRFGADGWPRTIILLIAIAAVLQAVTVLRRPVATEEQATAAGPSTETEGEQRPERGKFSRFRVAATLLLPIVYAGLLEPMGFYVLTPVFIALLLLLAGERRWKVVLGVTLGIYAGLVLLFGRLLYINLPVGNWHPFYDISNWLLVVIR